MIKSFRDKETAKIFRLERSKKLPSDIQQRAYNKLELLDAASSIEQMRFPPSNRLEKLKGDRSEQWSIRINEQWRICFKYNEQENYAYEAEIIDYH